MTDRVQAAGSFGQHAHSDAEVSRALDAVISSEVFAGSPRLREFLSYIVAETLCGRSGQISGKSIAVDIYRRELDNDDGAHNLVRVEARRLRRLLEGYYSDEGRDHPIKIEIPLGAYRPSFITTVTSPIDTAQTRQPPARLQHWLISGILGTALALSLLVIGILLWPVIEEQPQTSQTEEATLQALREKSVPTLQSANLAQQARGLLFPLFDKKRQQLALEMFLHAIELEPGIPHGYAGAAQVYATLTMLSEDPALAAEYSGKARDLANQALDLDPSNAWGHGALAWALGTGGEFEAAVKHANLAFKLTPEDGHVLDLVGIAAIITNEPQLAALASDPEKPRSGAGRFGARNIWGVSQYMLGNYPAVIEAFGNAPAEGAPVSPPSLIFLAIAYDHLGNTDAAQQLVNEISSTWPNSPTAFLVRRMFHAGSEYEQDMLNRLARYGYATG